MIRTSILGLACGAILAGSLAAMPGCTAAEESTDDVTSAETIRSANVALTLQDASGARIGEGSGILIAPRLVLTAAHLVAGKTKWSVKTADGKTANGTRGVTYDWLVYNSSKAHPRRHDVAVIYLDRPIRLSEYPKVSSTALPSSASATRIHGSGTSFTNIPSAFTRLSTFPNSYVTEMGKGETLDTGGAVLDARNHIVGVATGQGLTTGKLYVARVDGLSSWLAAKSKSCDSGKDDPYKDPVVVKTYTPPSSSSTSSSGSTTSSSGSTTSSSGSTTSSSGSTTSSSGSTTSSSGSTTSSSGSSTSSSGGTTCEEETSGNCYGECPPSTSSSSSSSSSTSSSGSSGTNELPPQPSSSSTSTGSSSGSTSSSTSSGSSGINEIPGTSTSTSSGETSSGLVSSSSSSGGVDRNACEGESDDPIACPPEDDGCQGPSCGGGSPDSNLSYGACACSGSGGDDDVDVR